MSPDQIQYGREGTRGERLNRDPRILRLISTLIAGGGYERIHFVQPAEGQLNSRTHRVRVEECVRNARDLSIATLSAARLHKAQGPLCGAVRRK
ncbi:hypothetical protein F5Y06DRAFT_280081 [Hypoxylon sp. FL0890]|nr:hypothetical protein F5Y06DRAFT_280081 [Hypoxylon sp. FL0890]